MRAAAGGRPGADGTVMVTPGAVHPMVLYHGRRRWPLPRSLGDSYGLPQELVTGHLADMLYTLIDLSTIPDHELSRRPELQAGLLVLKHALADDDSWQTLEHVVASAAVLGLTPMILVVRYLFKTAEMLDEARLRTILARFLHGQGQTVLSIIAQEMIAKARPAILAEGEAAGLTRGKADLLVRQLRRRFPALAAADEAGVREADGGQLDSWAERVLEAASPEDVFGPAEPC